MPPEPIIREDVFQATPDELFDAFTVPELVTHWLAQRADIDARPGGWWTFTWPPHNADSGRYLVVDRPSHLVWIWTAEVENIGLAPDGGETYPGITRDFTFEALPNGGTRLVIRETGAEDDSSHNEHAHDIDVMLEHLHDFVEKDERVDWNQPQAPEPD
ncbi:MAG TPA: SRPBCC family protein [Thermomicrobiales bacterium]|nr:SRPBCC family protein [Thermomicrobiales bacterium]